MRNTANWDFDGALSLPPLVTKFGTRGGRYEMASIAKCSP